MNMKIPSLRRLLGLGLLLAILHGCQDHGPPGLKVMDPWARAMMIQGVEGQEGAGGNSAVYLILRNEGGVADTLLGGASEAARAVEIHESYLEDDVMRMREVGPLEIPGGESVTLKPGGLHVMLLGLQESLVAGDSLSLTLEFRHSGSMRLQVPIRSPASGGM